MTQTKPTLASKLPRIFKLLWLLLLFGLPALRPMADPDFGWHLMEGERIATTGEFVTSLNYLNHSWLFDVLTYWSYSLVGLAGVAFLYLLVVGVCGLLAFRLLDSSFPAWQKTSLCLGFTTLAVLILGLRPQLVSLLGLLLVMSLIQGKKLEVLPVVFALWVNLHGGFVLGLAFVLANLIWQAVVVKKNLWRLALVGLTTLVATLINPFGLKLFSQLVSISTNQAAYNFNADWQPLLARTLGADTLPVRLGFLAVAGSVLFVGKGLARLPLLAMTLATLLSARWGLVVLALIPATWPKIKPSLLIIGVGVLSGLVIMGGLREFTCSLETTCTPTNWPYPDELVDTLRKQPPGYVLNYYTWGGYLLWQAPEHEYFIDGRMDSLVVDGDNMLARFAKIEKAEEGWRKLVDLGQVDYALFPTSSPIVTELEKLGFEVIGESGGGVLLVQRPTNNSQLPTKTDPTLPSPQ